MILDQVENQTWDLRFGKPLNKLCRTFNYFIVDCLCRQYLTEIFCLVLFTVAGDDDNASDNVLLSVVLSQDVREIALHRNNVLKDMIEEFQEEGILQHRIKMVFIDEREK